MPTIAKLVPAVAEGKRFTAIMSDGKRINFGQKDPVNGTYIDHHNKDLRNKYLARHLANKREKYLIENLIPSPALFSAVILWSYPDDKITSVRKNVEMLNNALRRAHSP